MLGEVIRHPLIHLLPEGQGFIEGGQPGVALHETTHEDLVGRGALGRALDVLLARNRRGASAEAHQRDDEGEAARPEHGGSYRSWAAASWMLTACSR